MAFNEVFLAHVPDADPEKHRWVLETSRYKLFVVMVKNQAQAIEVCKQLVPEQGIQSILLCPGFTHKDVADIAEMVGENAGVFVARGDDPSNEITTKAMEKQGWFSKSS